jgi:serine/threonine-protein kinase
MSAGTAPPYALPGETFGGKYRIERVLGQGGMGVVVLARHLDLDERVAIKFLVKTNDTSAVERFVREARAAAKVKSEHVCRVYDVGRLPTGEPYIVMEYLEGIDLARKLELEGPQPPQLVAHWMIEACEALAGAHHAGIVHRDLKPDNIFLAQRHDGSICTKVLDFGVSKLPTQSVMTNASAVMGTPLYMSPEQIASARDVDARADVWSLGVTMYEMLTGVSPFASNSLLSLIDAIRNKEPAPIQEVRPDLPDALAKVVMSCLAKEPAGRPANVAELVQGLAPFAPLEVQAIISRIGRRVPSVNEDGLPADDSKRKLELARTRPSNPEEDGSGLSPIAQTLPGGPPISSGNKPFSDSSGSSVPSSRKAISATLDPVSHAKPPRANAAVGRLAIGIGAVALLAVGLLVVKGSMSHDTAPRAQASAESTAPPPMARTAPATNTAATHPSEPVPIPAPAHEATVDASTTTAPSDAHAAIKSVLGKPKPAAPATAVSHVPAASAVTAAPSNPAPTAPKKPDIDRDNPL